VRHRVERSVVIRAPATRILETWRHLAGSFLRFLDFVEEVRLLDEVHDTSLHALSGALALPLGPGTRATSARVTLAATRRETVVRVVVEWFHARRDGLSAATCLLERDLERLRDQLESC
jgi:hypothetical protein